MAGIVRCPSCEKTLRVKDGVTADWLTCPRCLARVANPGAPMAQGIQVEAPPAPPRCEDIQASVPAAPRTCPACAEPVQEGWRVCPHCEEPLSPVSQGPPAFRIVDADVQRDQKGMTALGIVLGAKLLGVLLFIFLVGGGGRALGMNGVFVVVMLILGLAVIAAVLGAVGSQTRNPTVTTASRVAGGFARGFAVALVTVAVVIAASIVAVYLFLQSVCNALTHFNQ